MKRITLEVLDCLQIREQEFQISFDDLRQDADFSLKVAQAQQGHLNDLNDQGNEWDRQDQVGLGSHPQLLEKD